MNARQAAGIRLFNQQIVQSSRTSAAEVVARLGAIQAQDYRGALWSIGLRYPGSSISDVERAIADREIVRTWPMRRTLHFVAASDVRWMLQLLAPRMVRGSVGRMRQLGLDEPDFRRSTKALEKALRDGKAHTRDELYAVLERAKITTGAQRGTHILTRLSQDGLLCFASHRGSQPTFALLDEWVPDSRALTRDEALAELTLRYFRGHGPAGVRDLVWWAGITLGQARAGVAMVASALEEMKIGDTTQFVARDAATAPRSKRSVHLLPGFDEYLLGYTDRSIALDKAHASAIVPGNNGMFMPTIVAGGRVAGTWKASKTAKGTVVLPQPFAPLSDSDSRALAVASKRYVQFV
ncbi:MAG TPA: winged helix DNA-binding domain-containing protein, partial [Gemmatimonadaceae bacterium]|nr:winged helix DNA-binding domain-containing protein [Gemmatimonadaceae bacterium]